MPATAEIHTVKMPKTLETETCSRCCGSGRYSYCTMYGDTCFKCGGAGKVYTKRGLAAKAWLLEVRSRKASGLKVGDAIKGIAGSKFSRITSIEIETMEGASLKDGVMVPWRRTGFKVITGNCCHHLQANAMVEVLLTAEERAFTFRAALAYQETLKN